MGGRGPWPGPSARHVPCRPANQSRTTAFLARSIDDASRDFVSSTPNRPKRRADLHAARKVGDVMELSSAYPQPRHAAAYERGRIDG